MTVRTSLDATVTPLIRACAFAARLGCSTVTRVRVEGDIDAIPTSGPVILAANHTSNLDPLVLGGWLVPRMPRRIHWLGKRELFDWPVIGWLAANGGVHPVDRDAADVEAFRLARRILDDGQVLLVFPEGTRSPTGALQEARDGVAMLALRTGATIVPLAVSGTDRVWPKGRTLPRPGGRVTLHVGAPIRLGEVIPADADRRTAKAAATEAIMRRIAELLPPRQRGVYARAPEPAIRSTLTDER